MTIANPNPMEKHRQQIAKMQEYERQKAAIKEAMQPNVLDYIRAVKNVPKGSKIIDIQPRPRGLEVTYETEPQTQQAKAQKLLVVKQPSGTLTHSPMYSPSPQPVEAVKQESIEFYKSIGYPQFGGKYEPFIVPSGYSVETITETPSGLDIKFKSTAEPSKSLTQRMLDFQVTSHLPTTPSELAWMSRGRMPTTRPLASLAGVVAPTETLVYSVAHLAGVETPPSPPSLLETRMWTDMPSQYVVGAIMGEILLSIGISKGIQIVGKGIKIGAEKLVGTVEKATMPEAYYYYKNVLQKPMITTNVKIASSITKQYALGYFKEKTISLLGEEVYFYTTKIATPTLTQKILPTLATQARSAFFSTPLGESYLYAKAVAYPTLKHQISSVSMALTSQARSTFLASPFGETYLYAKAVAYPTLKYQIGNLITQRVTPFLSESLQQTKQVFYQTSLGEAILYQKSIGFKLSINIPKSLLISSYLQETRAFGKATSGLARYYTGLGKTTEPFVPRTPLSQLWKPTEQVSFAPRQVTQVIQISKTIPKETFKPFLFPILTSQTAQKEKTKTTKRTTVELIRHPFAYQGVQYPFRQTMTSWGKRLSAYPELKITSMPKEKLKQKEFLRYPTKPTVKQFLDVGTTQALHMKTNAMSKQMQKQAQKQTSKQLPQMRMPQLLETSQKRKHKKKEADVFGLFGRYKRQYPLASPQEVLKLVAGK